jgi:hypothetical protein
MATATRSNILVATRKGLFTVARGASGWAISAAEFLGDNVSIALHDPRDGARYAALDHGHFGVKLHRSTGAGWEEIASPQYPPRPEGLEEKDMWGKDIPWSTQRIWALETGGRDQPGVLWCGTMPGGLFRSSDHGATWQIVESLWHHPLRPKWMGAGMDLPGLHSIAVDPRDSRSVMIAVSTGGIWHTADSGATWTQRGRGMFNEHVPPELQTDPIAQDVHCLAQCQGHPSRVWVQHHACIYVSSDEGQTFTAPDNVEPSAFGFVVAAHPHDPATAWFVPAIKDEKRIPVAGKLVVTRTRDGGKTFETLSKGLPQEHAYDLIYRHGLAIDSTGDRLAMGSTTGGLWVTENGGDSWSLVSHTLPPIHAVRFA